ncbi:MAG: hypothetical protein KGH55_01725 [Nanoarchaeota archaeon]|nr:hypothetical protein [Nanoarchaeota archaeon]
MNKQKTAGVYFLALSLVTSIILLAAAVSAAQPLANFSSVKVNGLETLSGAPGYSSSVAVYAGENLPVTVSFAANVPESNVRMTVEIQGVSSDSQNEAFIGNIEAGQTYTQSLNLNVPSDIGDAPSGHVNMIVTIWNGDASVNQAQVPITLNEQRQSYDVQVMSMNTPQDVHGGDLVPIQVVLKNTGYNQLNDLYVTVSLPALNLQKTVYFGDLAVPGANDTVTGTVYLQVPYNAVAGAYTLQAEIKNSYLDSIAQTIMNISNEFQSNVVVDNPQQTANVGQSVTYNLEIVNPTSNINVYSIVPQMISGVSITGDSVITVPAGSSKTVSLTATPSSSGTYNLSVNVFSGGQLTGNAALMLGAQGISSNPVIILTIILTVIFVALLAVLIVLLTRKPVTEKKQEDFGESYY